MERDLAYQFSKGPVEVGAAELAGFLNGISYLNQDRRSNFAASFLLNCIVDDEIIPEINAIFQENPIPPFVVREEREINFGDLEQELSSSILCSSYIVDSGHEGDLGAYISFKIMDRIDDIFEPENVRRVKKLTGSFGSTDGTVTFYCLTSSSHTLVIYLHARAEKASH
jgi:hypothetical protein